MGLVLGQTNGKHADPRVSIVIPTRNRGKLLKFALKSALLQEYDNLEIVVCDNFSVDDTAAVARVDDPRVKYVRTSASLSMPDNWEFALTHATGDYVAYLTDDSYLLRGTIRHAIDEMRATGAQVAVWKHAGYFAADWLEEGRRNVLHVPNVSGESQLKSSRELLDRLYRLEMSVVTSVPKALNSIVHRSVIERVLAQQGRLFIPSCPDYSSAAAVLLQVDKCLVLDRIGFLDGVTPESIGAVSAFNLGESNKQFLREFTEDVDQLVFLGIPTATAAIGQSLERVRAANGPGCPPVNRENLLRTVVGDLARLEAHGADVTSYWAVLDEHLSGARAARPWSLRAYRTAARIKWRAIRRARLGRYTRGIDRMRGMDILRGDERGFTTIEGAAAELTRFLERKARVV